MLMIGNLPMYMCAKNYQNSTWFDKDIAKIKWCSLLEYEWTVLAIANGWLIWTDLRSD